jgi:hypothetical protein
MNDVPAAEIRRKNERKTTEKWFVVERGEKV